MGDNDELYSGAGDSNWATIDDVATVNRLFTKEQELHLYPKFTGLTVEKFLGTGDSFEILRINDMDAYTTTPDGAMA